jgi:glycosyltransferase involved in cell wall biosynthesis
VDDRIKTEYSGLIAAEQVQSAGNTDVSIVVVVPVFRHSVFLADAVESACRQDIDQEYRVVIVDDGCPFKETRRVAMTLAEAYEERVVYIRRPNGGLSAARNTGVKYALMRWPSTQAIYFLDADNFIETKALARAYAVLRSNLKLGWVYPDICMFGSVEEIWDYYGRYSVLRHLTDNVSEAGSMVRREVFERGCRFDESMRQGYEDWEFWWQCIEAGFVGQHVPFFGLRYRKRPESMVSQSMREHAAVISYMRRKHHKLFRAKSLLALETRDAPRYAILTSVSDVKICTDPRGKGETIDSDELAARYVAASQQPQLHSVPRFIIAASAPAKEFLEKIRLDRFALWWLEKQAGIENVAHFVAIEFVTSTQHVGVTITEMEAGYWPVETGAIHLFMAAPKILTECVNDEYDDWVRSLLSAAPHPKTAILRIEVEEGLYAAPILPNVLELWFDMFDRLHKRRRNLTPPMPMVKPRSLISNCDLGYTPSALLECGPVLPIADKSLRDICFVLPLVAFGGVEKVALNVAAEFRRSGWRCHLLVLAKEAMLDEKWFAAFDSVLFYHEPAMRQWSEAQKFLGTNYPEWAVWGDPQWLEGLLLPMDAVVNFHAADLFRVAGKLRSKGVALAASLHVNDKSQFDRDVGHCFLALGHEHVLDVVAPCSISLLEWCHAQGVPADKLVAIPNAPALDVTPDDVAATLSRRRRRRRASKGLNVLFLGRLDRQKGLDRLAAIIERCREQQLPICWRIVGGAVIKSHDGLDVYGLAGLCEPPIDDPAQIIETYAWADVLLLPSYWEGLPLTILEASCLGVVPVAARVGAVDEVVIHDVTGLLIEDLPLEPFVYAAVKQLTRLVENRGFLERLSEHVAETMTRTWKEACHEFIELMGAIVERNRL